MRGILVGACLWMMLGAAPASAPTLLVMGDSLSAAFGIPLEQGWVRLLQERLRQEGYPHRVVNGSVSGETTAGGLSRLPEALARHRPELVLIELGGNDGLRGLPLEELRGNLARMVRLGRKAGARVLLVEMRIPPNYGPAYTEGFHRSFESVARAEGASVVPFMLAPLVDRPDLFLEDGIHPTADAQSLLLDAVWPALRAELARAATRPARAPAAPAGARR